MPKNEGAGPAPKERIQDSPRPPRPSGATAQPLGSRPQLPHSPPPSKVPPGVLSSSLADPGPPCPGPLSSIPLWQPWVWGSSPAPGPLAGHLCCGHRPGSLASSPSSVIKTQAGAWGWGGQHHPQPVSLTTDRIRACLAVWLSSFLPAANQNHSERSAARRLCGVPGGRTFLPSPGLLPAPSLLGRWACPRGAPRSGDTGHLDISFYTPREKTKAFSEKACGQIRHRRAVG